MNADIYERHRQAVEEWRSACEAVKLSEGLRDRKRQALDNIGQELLASCANSISKPEKKTRRRRVKVDQELLTSSRVRLEHKPNGLEQDAN